LPREGEKPTIPKSLQVERERTLLHGEWRCEQNKKNLARRKHRSATKGKKGSRDRRRRDAQTHKRRKTKRNPCVSEDIRKRAASSCEKLAPKEKVPQKGLGLFSRAQKGGGGSRSKTACLSEKGTFTGEREKKQYATLLSKKIAQRGGGGGAGGGVAGAQKKREPVSEKRG